MALLGASSMLSISAQDVDYKKYPDYNPVIKPDTSLTNSFLWRSKAKKTSQERPAYVDNSRLKYFPSVFNQDGGSCGSASRISYMFNYEINCLRDADAALPENVYPSHFTWLLTGQNSGKEGMAAANGIPNIVTYGGRTYSNLFGNQDCEQSDYGWMQGYEKWFEAMNNRITSNGNLSLNVQTEAGRDLLKNWLWNHCGDEDFHAGGIAGFGVASACTQENIPNTEANQTAGVVGMKYVKTWGAQVDHALTIVGYDDRIEFDLNGNGVYGEKSADEIGAWIVVNSWGTGFANKGFIYCPYKHARVNTSTTGVWGGWYQPEVYYARKNFRPLRTMKVKIGYSKRSELRLSAGVSSDLNAEEPELTTVFEHFNYAGNGNGKSVDAETPMLGRWADGIHNEPMEFGYDLTDLSAALDTRKPLKYFFIIDSKASATGEGKVYHCSILDYEFDREGIETPFNIHAEGVTVQNKGNKTIISVVVRGESFNAPRNLQATGNQLAWQAPTLSSSPVENYRIYKDGELITTVVAGETTYNTSEEGLYAVSAVYKINGEVVESEKSNRVGPLQHAEGDNITRRFTNAGFNIPNVFAKRHQAMTIEYWLKPASLTNWNQQIGPGWGSFLIHTTSTGELVAGWANGEHRISTAAGTLAYNKWNHVAVVVKGSELTVYVNGTKKGSLVSTGYSGVPAIGNFVVGSNNNPMNGLMDEFRVWSEARTEEEINRCMKEEIGYPAGENNLLAYYKMDEISLDNKKYLRDCIGGNHASYTASSTQLVDKNLLSSDTLKAGISVPETLCYTGQPILLKNTSSARTCTWAWTSAGAGIENLNVPNPTLVFNAVGEHAVTLKVKDAQGNEAETTAMIQVIATQQPVVDFDMNVASIPAGEHISFINKTSNSEGCVYTWSMPGAEKESASTTNAGATYAEAGTYDVTLTATNSAGSHSVTKKVVILNTAPKADFAINPSIIVLGEKTYVVDKSKYSPSTWSWKIENSNNLMWIDGQNSSLTPQLPGRYDVTLKVSNEQGMGEITKKNALIVCNADGKNGLKLDGVDDEIVADGIFSAAQPNRFTIDWWMYPTQITDFCNRMGDKEETFLMKTDAAGSMHVFIKNKSVKSPTGFVIPFEWHHYAVCIGNNVVKLYRDAQKIAETPLVSISPEWTGGFNIGGSEYPMNAVIDELRIWGAILSENDIKNFSNEPIEDVKAAEATLTTKLQLYYNFNQSSGNVKDLTSNNYTGVRKNFGPDGDAWSSSRGIFCLSGKNNSTDVTKDYLVNYAMPFKTVSGSFVNGTSRFQKLQTETTASPWIIENAANDADKKITTEFYVDGGKANALTLQTTWDAFATEVNNLKLYQQCTLPAGAYVLNIANYAEFYTGGTYLVVAEGKGLPDTDLLSTASIGYAPLESKSLTFVLNKETTVSLGLLSNMAGKNCLTIKNLSLLSKPYMHVSADGADAVENLPVQSKPYAVKSAKGALQITCSDLQAVRVHSTTGTLLFQKTFSGMRKVQLPKGIYLVNGLKAIVF